MEILRARAHGHPPRFVCTRAHIKEHNNPNRNVRELNDRKKNKRTTLVFEDDDEEEYKDDDAPRRANVLVVVVVVVVVIAFVCILRCVCVYYYVSHRGNSLIIGENAVKINKISLVLSRPVLSRQLSKNLKPEIVHIYNQISLICVQKRLIAFRLIRHFYPREKRSI